MLWNLGPSKRVHFYVFTKKISFVWQKLHSQSSDQTLFLASRLIFVTWGLTSIWYKQKDLKTAITFEVQKMLMLVVRSLGGRLRVQIKNILWNTFETSPKKCWCRMWGARCRCRIFREILRIYSTPRTLLPTFQYLNHLMVVLE